MHPLSVSLVVTVCTWQQTNGIISSLSITCMHLVSSPALHAQCHTCSVNQITRPALIRFNDWVFPTFPFTHCIQWCRKTDGAGLTSKHLWSQSGGMRHGSAIKICRFPQIYCYGISQEKMRFWTILPQFPPSPTPSQTQILLTLCASLSFRRL